MPLLTKRWQVAPRIPSDVDYALAAYPSILRQLLHNRGYDTYETARQFLFAEAPVRSDPYTLFGLPEAVDRIRWAIEKQEKIAIYGDYDADGVTATALLTEVIRKLGGGAAGYIPNRFEEGYGLNTDALDTLHSDGTQLVVTVDCGIRSIKEAEYARQLGLDLIITDHHHPQAEIPDALAVINPKQPHDPYPEKELAGVGLAYKLAAALAGEMDLAAVRGPGPGNNLPLPEVLDLVALGTVADLAPLKGENRTLVREGLQCIRQSQRQGLYSLMQVAGIKPHLICAGDIGFGLGPRLNAAGRLESALAALNLLLTRDLSEAGVLAQQLERQNRERQKITREVQLEAERIALRDDPEALLLFAADPGFNPGVVGLAASRLTDRYYRPAIVAQKGEEFTRGSCRSIPEFHITDALDACADILVHHGGHAAAAGFTVRNENLPALVERLQEIAATKLTSHDLRPALIADLELPLSELKPGIIKDLNSLQPTGYGNPEAVFISRGLRVVKSRQVGKDSSHLKLSVTDGAITFDAIAFRQGHWHECMPKEIDLMYTFEVNEFNGRTSLQLNVRDIKPSGEED